MTDEASGGLALVPQVSGLSGSTIERLLEDGHGMASHGRRSVGARRVFFLFCFCLGLCRFFEGVPPPSPTFSFFFFFFVGKEKLKTSEEHGFQGHQGFLESIG